MTTRRTHDPANADSNFAREVGAQARRKRNTKQKAGRSALFGLGMMGVIGWSVVVPTVAGTALGVWLDEHHPSKHHYTLALLVLGLAVGCITAWRWVSKEEKGMREESKHDER